MQHCRLSNTVPEWEVLEYLIRISHRGKLIAQKGGDNEVYSVSGVEGVACVSL